MAYSSKTQTSIGCPREIYAGEKRVAQSPETVAQLVKRGVEVRIQSGAGVPANWTDEVYQAAGKLTFNLVS